jgi:hypothetical protein
MGFCPSGTIITKVKEGAYMKAKLRKFALLLTPLLLAALVLALRPVVNE